MGIEGEITIGSLLQLIAVLVSLISLTLTLLVRRAQRSARLALELLPRKDGVYISIRNIGDRIAYNVEPEIIPEKYAEIFSLLPALAPGTTYQIYICGYKNIPERPLVVKLKYNDPVHKLRKKHNSGTFDLSKLGSLRVSTDEEFNCFRLSQ